MKIYCPCTEWFVNLPRLGAPAAARARGNYKFAVKPFAYCPWCGNGVLEGSPPTSSGEHT